MRGSFFPGEGLERSGKRPTLKVGELFQQQTLTSPSYQKVHDESQDIQ